MCAFFFFSFYWYHWKPYLFCCLSTATWKRLVSLNFWTLFLLHRCQPPYSWQQILLVPPHWGRYDDCAESSRDEPVFGCVGCGVICCGGPWWNASQITDFHWALPLAHHNRKNLNKMNGFTYAFGLLINFTDFIFSYFSVNDLLKT